MVSIIIPAHNEEQVIARCLRAVTTGAGAGGLEVIVVCNGCSDRTAEVARRFGGVVRVIETAAASKTAALNLGDAAAEGFPRFYVDADVVLPLAAVRRMATVLEEGRVLAVAPAPRFELGGCSWGVRAFYDINGRLPSSREGIGGSGVYGVSQAGRRRWGEFPRLTADDGFVRVQFAADERRMVAGCESVVYAPRTLGELVAIKSRSHYGTQELRARCPELWHNKGPGNAAALRRLCLRPWLWAKLGAYAYVKVAARWRSRQKRRRGERGWERDETSRGMVKGEG